VHKRRSRRRPTAAKINIPDLAARLPNLQAGAILGIWRNAIRLMTDDLGGRRELGREALVAIEREWRRRRLSSISPDDFFKWPSTDAPGGDGGLSLLGAQQQGLLSYLEYNVGKTNGQPPSIRKLILDRVFLGELPPVFTPDYLNEWSTPGSAGRLQKMAESLAAFCRNAKRRNDARLADAIRDWETDLRYLYQTYYIARFHFGWPSSAI
jgi:hypothetical protein